jgi:PAS domain S-box-containing protein
MSDDLLVSLLETVFDGLEDMGALCLSADGLSVIASAGLPALFGLEHPPLPGAAAEPVWRALRALCDPDPGDLKALAFAGSDGVVVTVAGGVVSDLRLQLTVRDWQGLAAGPGQALLLLVKRRRDEAEALAALQHDYDVLNGVFRQLPVALVVVDRERRILRASDAACQLVGWSQDELIGRTTRILYADQAEYERVGRALYPANAVPVTAKARHRCGDLLDVEISIAGLTAPEGGPIGHVALVRDLTEQRQTSRSLHMLSQIVEQSPDSILVTDDQFRVTYLNPSCERLFGWTLDELRGESPGRLNAEPDADAKQQSIYEDLLAGRTVYVDHVLNRRKDGSLFHCQFWASPLRDETGGIIGYTASQRDVSQRIEDARALVEREAWNRRLIETAMEGIWALDANAVTTWVNPRLLDMLGYDESDLLGQSLYGFLDAKGAARARAGFERHRRGERFVVEATFHRKDGTPLHAIVSATPMFDEGHRFLGAFGMLTDISPRVAHERQREELLERQNILLDHLPALVFFKDTQNNILLTTESVARATGLPRSEIEGQPSAKIYPDLAERYYADDLEVIRSGQPKRGIVEPLEAADGQVRWLQTDKVPYRDKTGQVAGIVVFAIDVTEQKMAQLALAESERRFRTLYERIPQGVVMHALDGRVIEANPAACLILGVSRDEILGLSSTSPQWRCIREDGRDFPGVEHPAIRVLRSNEPVAGVIMGVRRPCDRGMVWILIDAVPLFHPASGELEGVFASFADITEARLMQQALVQSQKMEAIGQLSGGIAHDFNNILGSILGFCELAQVRADREDGRLHGYLSQIDSAATRAGNLVRQLLVFGRGEAVAPVAPAALHELLVDTADLLRPLLPPTITLDIRLDSPVSPLVGIDPLHFQQILLNLGSNARDAIGDRGELRLGTSVGQGAERACLVCGERIDGDWARLLVCDSGRGIPRDIQDKVFEPFFTTKPVGTGSGMGLAIVAGLLRTYRGHALLSSSPGEGTCFELLFPIVDGSSEEGAGTT